MITSTRIRHAAVWRVCLAVALILVLSSVVVSAARLQGRIKHDVYTPPAKNFRVPVPQGLGMRVSDGYSKDETSEIGAVSFHDDFGSLSAIHYMCVGPDAVEQLQQADLSVIANWLPQVAMPTWFLNASPDSRIVHQENGTFENMSVSVAQVEIPGGSPLVTLDASGKSTRMDSLRGLVIFQRGRCIYMLATEQKELSSVFGPQTPQSAPATASALEPGDEWKGFVDGLKPFYESIVFVD